MKCMKYYNHFLKPAEILCRGSFLGYDYMCLNLGPYPTAYVGIPKGKPFYNVCLCEEVWLDCHGGCTFVNWGHHMGINEFLKVVGWDYGHCSDFNGLVSVLPSFESLPKRKWTTSRIVLDCKNFIKSLYILDNWKCIYV